MHIRALDLVNLLDQSVQSIGHLLCGSVFTIQTPKQMGWNGRAWPTRHLRSRLSKCPMACPGQGLDLFSALEFLW